MADGIREAYADLFAVNTKANELSIADAKNKLRTLYAGKKTDLVIGNVAKTFRALCDLANFTAASQAKASAGNPVEPPPSVPEREPIVRPAAEETAPNLGRIRVSGLQYHINIVLPETRDQAVFDAIFKSLREHLG